MFEIVHTVTDWYDGPRRGIAYFLGEPHLFQSEYRDKSELDPDTFLLMPIDREVFKLSLEDWAIWQRWEAAYLSGQTTQATHPALPADRVRHDEIERLLSHRLVIDPIRSIRKRAEFQDRNDPSRSDYPLTVRWRDPD